MIHYHGLPITPESAGVRALTGAHAFITYRDPRQLPLAISVCQSFALDNGAFSAWRAGEPVKDWREYYAWVDRCRRIPSFDFAVIPDVIDGTEADNDRLVREWPWKHGPDIGAPVWHLHESLDRLVHLAAQWSRVCLGSSGDYATVGTSRWFHRMAQAMDVVCDRSSGVPFCKLHGLRMLDPAIYSRFPFASADSTNIARNVSIDQKWKGAYAPATLEARALVLRDRIESAQAPASWERESAGLQISLFPEMLDETP